MACINMKDQCLIPYRITFGFNSFCQLSFLKWQRDNYFNSWIWCIYYKNKVYMFIITSLNIYTNIAFSVQKYSHKKHPTAKMLLEFNLWLYLHCITEELSLIVEKATVLQLIIYAKENSSKIKTKIRRKVSSLSCPKT